MSVFHRGCTCSMLTYVRVWFQGQLTGGILLVVDGEALCVIVLLWESYVEAQWPGRPTQSRKCGALLVVCVAYPVSMGRKQTIRVAAAYQEHWTLE